MCGIFGLVGGPWRDAAPAALDTLATRGPDGSHLITSGACVLGHRRLAVIDLVTGDQPMTSPDGRHVIVFNGEIYNYKALRVSLQALGCVFRTQSDTEVLLHGYVRWGEALLPRLDGMFALAIWDSVGQSLFVARDRMGIKPLFYSTLQGFVFGSTLAPFLALPGFPASLDPQALRDFLGFQASLAPDSFLTQVRQLAPAHWLRYDARSNRHTLQRWWMIPRPQEASANQQAGADHVQGDATQLLDRVDAALAESVKRQLVADVPLGAFLSGGIDSSLMVHYMAQAGASPLETFTLRFEDEDFDESRHALEVANHFGARHHLLDAPSIDGAGFTAAIQAQDQPLADPAYVMTHALARLTRQHVTVALSGDGGDELFGGYGRFWETDPLLPSRPWQPWLRALVEHGLAPAVAFRRALSGRDLLLYRHTEVGPWARGRKRLAGLLTDTTYARAQPQRTMGAWLDLIDELGGRPDAATLMRADLWTYLSENCLAKTDRASMAFGLEVRVPMLGNPVLDVVLSQPAQVHAAGGGKALLRAIARRTLPSTVWDRPKHGFSVPLLRLFSGAWRQACEAAVNDSARLAPFLDARAVHKLWEDARAGRASRRLAYTVITLLIWLQTHRLSL